jgi:hypothetical protein
MSWEETEKYVRSGHRAPEEFQQGTQKTVTLNEIDGIQALVGKPNGKQTMEIQSYLFSKDKGWTVEKAKEWFDKHYIPAKEHVYAVLPFVIAEKIMEKPLLPLASPWISSTKPTSTPSSTIEAPKLRAKLWSLPIGYLLNRSQTARSKRMADSPAQRTAQPATAWMSGARCQLC